MLTANDYPSARGTYLVHTMMYHQSRSVHLPLHCESAPLTILVNAMGLLTCTDPPIVRMATCHGAAGRVRLSGRLSLLPVISTHKCDDDGADYGGHAPLSKTQQLVLPHHNLDRSLTSQQVKVKVKRALPHLTSYLLLSMSLLTIQTYEHLYILTLQWHTRRLHFMPAMEFLPTPPIVGTSSHLIPVVQLKSQ